MTTIMTAMTTATAIGLLAIFAVDFINLFYLNKLGQVAISAAAGYATTVFFFLISIGIGCTIAASALVAPARIGKPANQARRVARNPA